MNANQKPNRYQSTSHQTLQLQEDWIKESSANYLPTNNLLNSPGLDMPATSKAHTLGAFDWKHTINETYFNLDVSFRQPNKFFGFLQHAKLIDIGVSHYHANTVHYNRGTQSSDCYDDSILITFPIAGDVHFTQKGRQLTSKPGQFFIELSSLPYEFYHLHEASLYVVKIPLALLTAQMSSIERQFARSLTISEGAGRLLVFQIRQILELTHHHQLTPIEVKILEQQLLNLVVMALIVPKEVMMAESSSIQSVHLKRIENYVYLHLENPSLTPSMVATACHISVRYLHKLFADLPYSFSEWIKEIRLKKANHILKTRSYVTIDEVAHRVGYGDQSYFSRIYKQHFGYVPRDTHKL